MKITLAVLQAAVAASAEAILRSSVGTATGACTSKGLSSPSRAIMSIAENSREVMQVKKLSDNAVMPVRGSEHAAGFDLASAYEATVPAGRQALINTDLSIAIPPNTYARIAPRSGLAVKKMIDVGAGVVDYDYRGPVGVVLFNHGTEDFKVNKGDRVAQLILERISMAELEEVTELSETARGAGGFGSTGVERAALNEVTAIANGFKKLKASKPREALGEHLGYAFDLIRLVAEALDVETTSDLLLPLREAAIRGMAMDRLEGIIGSYIKTKNVNELAADVKVLANHFS